MEAITKLMFIPNKIISKANSTNNRLGLKVMINKAKKMNKVDKNNEVSIKFYLCQSNYVQRLLNNHSKVVLNLVRDLIWMLFDL